jgi:predicted ATPase
LALLVFLAVESRIAHRRERLVELLWPRAATGEGRHSLSTALSVLRARLGRPAVKSSRDHVQLVLSDLDLDLHRLTEGQLLETDLLPALELGGFLEDFDVPGAPEFALWRDQQQARWLPHIRDALLFLIDRCRRTGDFAQIERYADRMLALDDLSEDGMRAKMEARAFAGDRLTALRLFEEWKKKLHTELDAAPSQLIEGMAIRLRRRGWERSNTKEIAPVPTDQWKGRRFVGRTQEYAALYEAWESTASRSPRHVFVVGDSGVGKSTLVERLATAAGLSGGVSSRVQCYDLEHEIPYAALSNLLHGLIVLPGASATSPEALAELSRSTPRVREHFQSIPTPRDSQGENSRIRLADAVQQLVCSVAEEQPVMLVVDDFHLADDASISVIHLLMRRLESNRVMVLLTARTGELGRSPNANRLREAQARLNMTTIELPPLADDESAELIATLIDPNESAPKGALLQAFIRAGAGFPMALELLIEDWKLNGDRCLALSLGAMTEEPLADSAPGDAYRKLLDRLSMGLDPTTRNVLNLAAVLGPRLNDLGMYALMDMSLGQTMGAMSQLTELRMLRDGTHGLEFVNELIRAQTYLKVPSPLRRTLHGRIADNLLELGEQATQAAGLEIAWHCVRAGRPDEATPYLLQGARAAMRRGAPYEAERALASAVGHLQEPERSEAVILLARALNEQGRRKESLAVVERARPLSTPDYEDLARILVIGARLQAFPQRIEEQRSEVDELLRIAKATSNNAIRAEAVTVAGLEIPAGDSPGLDRTLLDIMERVAYGDLDTEGYGALAYAKARIHHRMRDLQAGHNEIRSALRDITEEGLRSSVASRLFHGEANLCAVGGDYSAALRAYQQSWDVAEHLDDDFLRRSIAGNIAICLCRLGNFDSQIDWAERAVRISFRTGAPYHITQHSGTLALGYALLGNNAQAHEVRRRCDKLLAVCTEASIQQAWSLYSADVFQVMGEREEALNRARRAGAASGENFLMTDIVGRYSRWTAICSAMENRPEGRRILDDLRDRRQTFDKIDQIEILSACVWYDHATGAFPSEHVARYERELAAMPGGVRILLERLGMLPVDHEKDAKADWSSTLP